MNYKALRQAIKVQTSSQQAAEHILSILGIDVTRDHFFKVREERTPSSRVNKNGSCHDYGTGDHYSDLVSLLFDGYHAFDSLPETMEWICNEINIDTEVYCG